MISEQPSPESNPNAVDLSVLVDTALQRHTETEWVDVHDGAFTTYYHSNMAATDVLKEVVEQRRIDIRQVAVYLSEVTSVDPQDLISFFELGSRGDFDGLFWLMEEEIIYAEMRLKKPEIVEIDIKRDLRAVGRHKTIDKSE